MPEAKVFLYLAGLGIVKKTFDTVTNTLTSIPIPELCFFGNQFEQIHFDRKKIT